MPTLTIPEEHTGGLARIMSLSLEESHHVVDALGRAKTVNLRDLTALVATNLPTLALNEVREIVQTLLSLYSARTAMDMTVDSFVTDLITAAKQIQPELPQPPEALQETLKSLLSVRPLSMISKARGVHTDHENTFCSVRILTDLRPVFDVDIKAGPVGFVLVHMLKLGYHHSGKHTTIHVAMDKTDIDTLILTLQRAKLKSGTITATIADKAGFDILAD
jgi:hypothetical protein